MMSISERERQTLESIENGLVRSAPKLASMLAIFTRLGPAAGRWLWLAIAVALLTLVVTMGHGSGRTACTATRAAATCRQVPAPARPVANRPGGVMTGRQRHRAGG
jgi:hypothetical protein